VIVQHILLALLWILYGLLHSWLAGISFKRKAKQWMKDQYQYYRIYYTVFAFVTFAAILYYQIQLTTPLLWPITTATILTGGVITLAGLTLMGICIRKYFFSLSGLKSLFTKNTSNTLIISGIHKYMRHPLYLGTFVFIWGLLIMLPYISLLISNTIITAYTLIGIQLEEEKLVEEFGDDYRKYQQTVPRLIPFLKNRKAV